MSPISDQCSADHAAQAVDSRLEGSETVVHRSALDVGDLVLAVEHGHHPIAVISFLISKLGERFSCALVFLVVGPRLEGIRGGALAVRCGPENLLFRQVRVRECDQQFGRSESLEFDGHRFFECRPKFVGGHTEPTPPIVLKLGGDPVSPAGGSERDFTCLDRVRSDMTDRIDHADRPDDEQPSIAPDALADRLQSGDETTVLDVRDRDEFERWHLEGDAIEAVQIPHVRFIQAQATGDVDDLVADLSEPIVAVCGRGEASAHAVGLLREAGIEAQNLAGGMDAWADLYVARELEVDAPARVFQYDRPSSGCLSYSIVSGDEVAVIDPLRAFSDRYVEDAAGFGAELAYAIDTHVHADHVSGVRDLASRTEAESVLPGGARARGLVFDAVTLEDGDELDIGESALTAMATPGHTTESLSFRLGSVLFTGDTLFLEGVGRPDLEGGSEEAPAAARRLFESLRDRVLEQPSETVIAPGHYSTAADPRADGTYADRLEALRDRLAALSMTEDEFVTHATSDLPPRPANHGRIVATNLGLEDVDPETAFELELGPNNCAVAD